MKDIHRGEADFLQEIQDALGLDVLHATLGAWFALSTTSVPSPFFLGK